MSQTELIGGDCLITSSNTMKKEDPEQLEISAADVRHDVTHMMWSMKLYNIRRFYEQRFWESETDESKFAQRVEPFPRLESVAEHSWHLADCALLLAPHFEELDQKRCIELAIIHDKLEIFTGDYNPIGRDGKGKRTHAFNFSAAETKKLAEEAALDRLLLKLRPSCRESYRSLFKELAEAKTPESRFIKVLDKLQVLIFIFFKKQGDMSDAHLRFTFSYAGGALSSYPKLYDHYDLIKSRIVRQVARKRGCSDLAISSLIDDNRQLHLWGT